MTRTGIETRDRQMKNALRRVRGEPSIGSAFSWNRACDRRHTSRVGGATEWAPIHQTGLDYSKCIFPQYTPKVTGI